MKTPFPGRVAWLAGLCLSLLVGAGCGRFDPPAATAASPLVPGRADELCRPCNNGCAKGFACTRLDAKPSAPAVCAAACLVDADCALFPERTGRCVATTPGADGQVRPVVTESGPGGVPAAFLPCSGTGCVCLADAGWCPHRCIAGKWQSCNSAGLEDADGCEQDLADAAFCGACAKERDCTTLFPNAVGRCKDGHSCVLTQDDCLSGFADCDGLAHNGCETKVTSDGHCGGCGKACGVSEHVQTRCGKDLGCVYATVEIAGKLALACEDGWADCKKRAACDGILGADEWIACQAAIQPAVDGSAAGCETRLGTMSDCGGCGKACTATAEKPQVCEDGACTATACAVGSIQCGSKCVPLGLDTRCAGCSDDCTDGAIGDEPGKCCVQMQTMADGSQPDASNCVKLSDALAQAGDDADKQQDALAALACHTAACKAGWANCDGSPDGSCETHVASSVDDCGACGVDCTAQAATWKHAVTSSCNAGKCKFGCEDGYTTCGSDAVCVTKLGTNAHCKACGDKCKTGLVCDKGICQCPPDKVACTKDGVTSCKTPGVDLCEVCGDKCLQSNACSLVDGKYTCKACPGATAYCIAGQDCVPVNVPERCGNCDNNCLAGTPKNVVPGADGKPDVTCSLQGGTYTCDYACKPGYGDCDQAVAGCESALTTWPHCSGCLACENVADVADGAMVCQSAAGQAPCGKYLKAPSAPAKKTEQVDDKTVQVTWTSGCKYGYFDCNWADTTQGLDGCECRTQMTWSTPPAWLLDCSSACKGGQCSCDYAAIRAVACGDVKNKCL